MTAPAPASTAGELNLPPAAPVIAAPAKPLSQAPLMSLFGVLVVWASLIIVFTANRLSEPYYHIDVNGLSSLNRNSSVLMSLDPQVKILLPFSMFAPRMTRGEALKTVGSYISFHVAEEGLAKLPEGRQNFRYEDAPVYAVLHGLINSPALGIMVENNNLSVFDQKLEIKQTTPGVHEMLWDAELNLSAQRTLVSPTGELPVWLSFRLTGESNQEISRWNVIQVEVHRGAELLAMTRAALDDKGNAAMSMSDVQTISLRIQRLARPAQQKPGRYQISFHYQANE